MTADARDTQVPQGGDSDTETQKSITKTADARETMKLLPCPFCGDEVHTRIVDNVGRPLQIIVCATCPQEFSLSVDEWNRRAKEQAERERVGKLLKAARGVLPAIRRYLSWYPMAGSKHADAELRANRLDEALAAFPEEQ